MRCRYSFSPRTPVVKAFRRHGNKHSEEEPTLFARLLGTAKMGSSSWRRKHSKSLTLCQLQELARGALKQCRETRASSLPFLSTWRSAAALADPTLWGAAWESSTILALLDLGLLCCRMARTALTQTTRWTVTFLTIAKDWKCGCDLRCGTLLSWLTCWRLPLTPLAEFTPGQSLWSRSSWTRRMRTPGGCPWPPLLSSPQGKACDQDQAELQG